MGSGSPKSNENQPPVPPSSQGMMPPNSQRPTGGQANPPNMAQNYPGQPPPNFQNRPSQSQMPPSSMPPNYSNMPPNQFNPSFKPQNSGNIPTNFQGQPQNIPYPPGNQQMPGSYPNNPNEILTPKYPPQYSGNAPGRNSPQYSGQLPPNQNAMQSFGPNQGPQNFQNPYPPNAPSNPNIIAQNYGNNNFQPIQGSSQSSNPNSFSNANQPTYYPPNSNVPQYPSNYPANQPSQNLAPQNQYSQYGYPPPNPNDPYQAQSSQFPSNYPNQNQPYLAPPSQNPTNLSSQNPHYPPPFQQYPPNYPNQNNQFQPNNLAPQNNPPSNIAYPNQSSNQPYVSQYAPNSPQQAPFNWDPKISTTPPYPQYNSNNAYGGFPSFHQQNDPLNPQQNFPASNSIPPIPYADIYSPRLPPDYEIHSPIRSEPIARIISPVRSITPPIRHYLSPTRVITHRSIHDNEFASSQPLTDAPRLISSRIIPLDYPSDVVQDPYYTNGLNSDIIPHSYSQALEYPITEIPSKGRLVSRQIMGANMGSNRIDYYPSKTFSPTRIKTSYSQYKNYELPVVQNLEANYPVGPVQEGNGYGMEPTINYANEVHSIQNIPRGTLVNYEYPPIQTLNKPIPTEYEMMEPYLSGGNKVRIA